MSIRAVVLDIGSVLEVIDESVFPGPWEERLGLGHGGFGRAVDMRGDGLAGDPGLGEVSEAEIRAHWMARLHLDDAAADELMRDYWRWYCGTLDQHLFDWFAALRPRFRTAILSNSSAGAREQEGQWGFATITDDLIYSHEVGLAKPDPAIYELTRSRIGVRADEIVFLDDVAENVAAARACGWHAVLHVDARQSIADVERVIAELALSPDGA